MGCVGAGMTEVAEAGGGGGAEEAEVEWPEGRRIGGNRLGCGAAAAWALPM